MIDNLLRRSVPPERWGQPVTSVYDYALMVAATMTAAGWLWLDHDLMLPALLVWFGLFACFAWTIFQWRQGWRISMVHRWACGVYALPVLLPCVVMFAVATVLAMSMLMAERRFRW